VNHHKEVHAHEACINLLWVRIASFKYFLLSDLLAPFNHVDELGIGVESVALLEDDRTHSHVVLRQTDSIDLELAEIAVVLLLCLLFHFDFPTLRSSEVLMRLAYVLVLIVWQESEVVGRDDLSKDTFTPLLTSLLLVFDLQVL